MYTRDQDMRVRYPHESREILEILGESTTLRLKGSFNCQPFECVTFYDPGHEASIGEYEDYMIATIRSIRESRFFGFDNIPTSRISWVIVGPENWDLLFRSEFQDQAAADRFPWAQICIRGSNQNLIVARGGMFEERAFPRVVAHSGRLIQSGDNSAQYLGGSYTTYSTERAKDLNRLKPDVVRELLHEFAHLFQARKEPMAVMMDNPALTEGEVETFARIFMNTQHDLPESTRFLAQINPTKHSWDELNDPNNGIEFPAEPVGTNEIYGMWFLGYLGLAYNLGLVNFLLDNNFSDDLRHPWNSIHTSLSQLDVANPESLLQFNRAIIADPLGNDERIRFIREYIVDQGLMRLREIMEAADGHIDLDRSLTAGCVQTGQKVLAFLYPFHLVDSEGNILYDQPKASPEPEYYI